jgi:hypothetical protein
MVPTLLLLTLLLLTLLLLTLLLLTLLLLTLLLLTLSSSPGWASADFPARVTAHHTGTAGEPRTTILVKFSAQVMAREASL